MVNYYSLILVTRAKMKTMTSALIRSAPYKNETNILVAAGLKIQVPRVKLLPSAVVPQPKSPTSACNQMQTVAFRLGHTGSVCLFANICPSIYKNLQMCVCVKEEEKEKNPRPTNPPPNQPTQERHVQSWFWPLIFNEKTQRWTSKTKDTENPWRGPIVFLMLNSTAHLQIYFTVTSKAWPSRKCSTPYHYSTQDESLAPSL